MFLKNHQTVNSEVSGQLISIGGTKMEDGRTWSHSQVLFSRGFQVTNSGINLEKLTHLKSFQVTSSHKNKTSSGSSTPRLMNAAFCDLETPESSEIKAVIYGGQSVDSGLTSDEIVIIKGTITKDISKADIDVTRFPAAHTHYTEFRVPANWPDGRDLVQVGEIPEGRTASKLSFLKQIGSSDLLVSVGGHSKPEYSTDIRHPKASLNLLLVPEMRWWKLLPSQVCQRSFHSQVSSNNGSDVIILGGMSMKNGRWAKVHPLNHFTKIHIEEDFSYTEVTFNLTTDVDTSLSFITNFSSWGNENVVFLYSGFVFPKYDQEKENLYKFQPPIAKRNKLPKISCDLFKVDLVDQKVTLCSSLKECGAYNGSIVNISDDRNPPELLIHADPKVLLYSERIINVAKCDLTVQYGFCSLPVVEKNHDSYICSTPACEVQIHVLCDKSIRTKPSEHPFCPTCRNLDPVTWKPKPGSKRPRFGRN